MYYIGVWFLTIICIEAITEIITQSDLLFNFRNKICNSIGSDSKLCTLVTCGYCLSVWVSIPFALFLPGQLVEFILIDFIIKTFSLHRLSNLFHAVLIRRIEGVPVQLVLIKDEVRKS